MTLDTGAGPGVANPRTAERPAALDPDATRALALVTVDPFTGAARSVRSPVPAPPAALAQSGRVAPRPRVTAILVSRDAEGRLARTLGAVAAQTRRPDLLVAADTGSTDRTRAMLAGRSQPQRRKQPVDVDHCAAADHRQRATQQVPRHR